MEGAVGGRFGDTAQHLAFFTLHWHQTSGATGLQSERKRSRITPAQTAQARAAPALVPDGDALLKCQLKKRPTAISPDFEDGAITKMARNQRHSLIPLPHGGAIEVVEVVDLLNKVAWGLPLRHIPQSDTGGLVPPLSAGRRNRYPPVVP